MTLGVILSVSELPAPDNMTPVELIRVTRHPFSVSPWRTITPSTTAYFLFSPIKSTCTALALGRGVAPGVVCDEGAAGGRIGSIRVWANTAAGVM